MPGIARQRIPARSRPTAPGWRNARRSGTNHLVTTALTALLLLCLNQEPPDSWRELDLPFIIVSGSIGEEVLAAAMTAGAHDYIPKDNLSRVVPAVKRLLSEAAERKERRRSDLALRESEERYALAVLGSRDGPWDWSLVTGRVYYSSRFKGMLGFEEDAFGDTIASFTDLIHEDHRDMVLLPEEMTSQIMICVSRAKSPQLVLDL